MSRIEGCRPEAVKARAGEGARGRARTMRWSGTRVCCTIHTIKRASRETERMSSSASAASAAAACSDDLPPVMGGHASCHNNSNTHVRSPSDELPPLSAVAPAPVLNNQQPQQHPLQPAPVAVPSPPAASLNNSFSPSPSPLTHAVRPYPVVVQHKLVKSRLPASSPPGHSGTGAGSGAQGGKAINGRLLMHVLGEGATAEVTLCQDPNTGEHFALKKMSKRALLKQKEYGQGPMGRPKITTGLDKVRREIELMSLVWHPNVLVLESVIDDPEEDALIMVLEYASQGQIMTFDSKELKYRNHVFNKAPSAHAKNNHAHALAATTAETVPAGAAAAAATAAADAPAAAAASSSSSSSSAAAPSAASHLSHDSPIPESILRKVLLDVINGLEYLHSLRIIHRDIKPDNLLLAGDGSVKICDLGVARRFGPDEDILISETHGTYHFFAPEMCSGERYSGFVADIWAVGVCLYILATGGLVPFMSADNNPSELFGLISEHKKGTLLFPPENQTTDLLKQLVEDIMDPDPKTRLTIQQIRCHPWMLNTPISPLVHDLAVLHIASPVLVPNVI